MRTSSLLALLLAAGCIQLDPLATDNPDADGDGFAADVDCDDTRADVRPEGVERCDHDGVDEDCNGLANEDDPGLSDGSAFFADLDNDGFGDIDAVVVACDAGEDVATEAGDCDDTDGDVHPAAQEVCDADDVDEDCDGAADDDDADVDPEGFTVSYPDSDGDGYGVGSRELAGCDALDGWVTNTFDCDDNESAINPDATEVCDGADNDCDGYADDARATDARAWYVDADEDGYGLDTSTRTACSRPEGFVASAGDCDDTRPNVHPGATESCNDLDDDCDGSTDESGTNAGTWYRDADGDGYGDAASSRSACDAPAGYLADATDCDDSDASVSPADSEVCDTGGVDEDCDGFVNDDDDSTLDAGKISLYYDGDGDGYGDASISMELCEAGTDWSTNDDDCNDDAATANPAGSEVCDSGDIDEDCDGLTDDSDTSTSAASKTTYYLDADADGYGVSTTSAARCEQPSGYSTYSTDCDDSNASRWPGNTEVCDAADLDEDCDSLSDDSDPSTSVASKTSWFLDADADGYGDDAGTGSTRCSAPGAGYVAGNSDCDDADAAVNPAAADVCFDSVDSDCDGSSGCALTDADADRELTGESTYDYAGMANSLAGAGDVNGDGYDDVIVGADGNDSGGSSAGRAYLVHGTASGTDLDLSAATALLTGEDTYDYAGYSVAGLGDFNGDGYDDVAVGAYGDDDGASGAGATYIVKGPVSTLDLSAATYKLRGVAASDASGTAIAGVGDVNGTGKGALLIGAPVYNSNSGRVYVVTAASTGSSSLTTSAAATLTGESTSDYAGQSLSGAGDVNGDGYDDFLVGAACDDDVASASGAAYLFLGPVTGSASLSTADGKLRGYSSSDYLGSTVSGGGDLNDDGYDDMALVASGYSSGTAYVVNGPYTGTSTITSVVDAYVYSVGAASAAVGGDVDGDGVGDLLLGASSSNKTYGFFGPVSGALTLSASDLTITASAGYFGSSVVFVGDHDNDGAEDFAVGQYGDDDGGSDAGAAHIFLNAGL